MSEDGRPGSATEVVVAHCNLLFTVACEMLGSAAPVRLASSLRSGRCTRRPGPRCAVWLSSGALPSSPDEPATRVFRDNPPQEDHIVCLAERASLSGLVTAWRAVMRSPSNSGTRTANSRPSPLEQIRSAIATIDDVWLLAADDIFSDSASRRT